MDYLQKYKKYKQKYIILKNKQKGGEELPKLNKINKDIIKDNIIFFKDIINELNNYNKLIEVFKKDINNKNEELIELIDKKGKIEHKEERDEREKEQLINIQQQIIEISKYIEETEQKIKNTNESMQMFQEELKTNEKYKRYLELKDNPLFLYIIGLNNKDIQPINISSDYIAAGIIFTDGRHILGGYQPKKRTPFISGIGGMKEPGETYMITAIRETLEELFDLENIPEELLNKLNQELKNKQIMQNNTYISIICTFEDLQIIFNLLKKHNIESRLYDEIPNNLYDLIFKRKINKDSEIAQLCILPLVNHDKKNLFVDSYFISDFAQLIDNK
jgi:hypothetical protein